MKTDAKIMIIDDDKDVLLAARLLLKKHFTQVKTLNDPALFLPQMEKENFDVILLDMNFTKDATSGKEGLYWLEKIRDIDPLAVVILITAYGDVETAVQTIKKGATDFVLKPWENDRLVATTATALKLRRSNTKLAQSEDREKQLSRDLDSRFQSMIGSSPQMGAVFAMIDRVSATDANVLISGENGTGKELVARALHRKSLRADQVFISVDMGAISESLFESELFGHVKGAFTDAKEGRAGRFEIASGGTLFLDEITNLPLPLQAKLLRTLEERSVVPVGSNKPIPIDIRLLCATNSSIHQLAGENRFRQDLLYRINTVEIQLPPLRERGADIGLLAQFFMVQYAKKYKKPVRKIRQSAITKLNRYHWPGNIRELRHTLERAVIMCDTETLEPDDFLFPDVHTEKSNFDTYNLNHIERDVIKTVLQKQDGNISRAAEVLGLTRAALYRRMNKYDL